MNWEKRISRYDIPLRLTFKDVIFYFGAELKKVGFDLDKELQYSATHIVDSIEDVYIRVYQQDRFRVRPANEFYPYAIL